MDGGLSIVVRDRHAVRLFQWAQTAVSPGPSLLSFFFEDFWRSQGHKGEKTHTCPLHGSSRSTVKEAGTAWSPEGCDEHRLGESP